MTFQAKPRRRRNGEGALVITPDLISAYSEGIGDAVDVVEPGSY